jgi:beta-1,4-mannooligosaccharide/beta-1,4-mannosyl-N-acetylglucosamine phosphorylase
MYPAGEKMKRHPNNPILTRGDIPEIPPYFSDVSSVFNPGAVKVGGRYLLMLRVQNRGRETFSVMAGSDDGVKFKVAGNIVHFRGIEKVKDMVYHCYDSRITRIEDHYYIMFAMDMADGCQLGLARTDNFESFEFMGIVSRGDIRNGVLFPEKVNGTYLRMDRPNLSTLEGGVASGRTIWLSSSDDLLTWTPVKPLIEGRFHYWDERVGSGPPPVKTKEGWLHLYHGIAEHFGSSVIYQAGVFLLDLKDPTKVLARSRYNILEPRELYELTGQVPNVCFPSGMIVEESDNRGFASLDSEVKIYYGAADTVVGLAQTTIRELIAAAYEGS